MRIYRTVDQSGAEVTHIASDRFSAIQAHLFHFGLFYTHVLDVHDLGDPEDQECLHTHSDSLCKDPVCQQVGRLIFDN